MDDTQKRFGIEVKMPAGDPFLAPHLLGDEWSGARWYDTAEHRDAALADMENHPNYYRKGDSPSIVLRKIDR